MRTILLFFALLFVNLTFSQATINQSFGSVQSNITNPIFQQPGEIFRFRAGSVRQLDAGPSFNFNNSRWFSLGSVNTGSQTVYGLRFQLPNKALTFGYQNVNSANPRIQWIGTGSNLGNLEFRSANSFTSTTSRLVATMNSNGNTIFGNPAVTGNSAKVSIENTGQTGLRIRQSSGVLTSSSTIGFSVDQTVGSQNNYGGILSTVNGNRVYGLYMKTAQGGQSSIGIQSFAYDSPNNNIGVRGTTFGTGNFEAGIYGDTPNNNGNNYAGYFDGDVITVGGTYLPSDKRLKDNITEETKVLERLALLRPVTYDYKKMDELNLSSQKQHGFISQELAEVFPELTKDITKPVFDKEGKIISTSSMKAINYNGLISVLTAGVKELNDEVALLKQELADLKRNSNGTSLENNNRAILKQNIPNPFADRTSISYQLPEGSNRASLMVFNMNGKIIKEFPLTKGSGEITINASQIGKGLFIYSLVQDGQELISKKMVIK